MPSIKEEPSTEVVGLGVALTEGEHEDGPGTGAGNLGLEDEPEDLMPPPDGATGGPSDEPVIGSAMFEWDEIVAADGGTPFEAEGGDEEEGRDVATGGTEDATSEL